MIIASQCNDLKKFNHLAIIDKHSFLYVYVILILKIYTCEIYLTYLSFLHNSKL